VIITNLLSFITKRESRKFLQLDEAISDEVVQKPGDRVEEEVSLYVHIPFCRALCPFCCFNRYLFDEGKAREYYKNLKRELDLYVQKGFRFSSVYFGGGTPTVLMDELLGFIDYLKENFEIKEISLETIPPEINQQSIQLLKTAGIKRLSVGVQSFDDDILKAMGRLFCTGEEAKERLLLAQGHFDTLNADFIFNFPFQPIDKFEADVKIFKDMGIDQATFYPLMPSPHKRDDLEREFQRVDNSREKKYYDVILRELYAKGYKASTVWCFSRGERMIDEYIVDFADYVGIGSGSVSLVKGMLYVNAFSLDNYGNMLQNNRFPIVRRRRLSEKEYLYYYLLTKLFGMKIDTQRFRQRFNYDINQKLGKELLFLRLSGLIEGEEIIRVTQRGMYPVSVMMRDFFAGLNSLREYCIQNQI